MVDSCMAKKLYIETVGCQMNVLDSELVVASHDEKIWSVAQLAGLLAVPTGAWRLSVERGGKVYSLAIQG